MNGHLVVESAGPGVTIQDRGRLGLMRFGVTPAGPMDALAHAFANRLLGNDAGAAAVEIPPGGLAVRAVAGPVTVAFAGGDFDIRRDGRVVGPAGRLTLAPGEGLGLRAGAAGVYAYLALAGGVDVEPVLGSRATHLRSGLGPFGGRALRPGDRLPPGRTAAVEERVALAGPATGDGPIRVMAGPQADHFADGELERLAAAEFVVGARSDRMALQLEGTRLCHRAGHDIVSDGIVMGAIQVPGDGRPFVLMADRQPTGGYPKIACVIDADLPRLAQTRTGARLRFGLCDAAGAATARAAARAALAAALAAAEAPVLTTEALLGANLVGGMIDALAETEQAEQRPADACPSQSVRIVP